MVFRETESVELKRLLNDGFEKALVAFLNTSGGTIYVGVEDDGTAVGVMNLDETLQKIGDIITMQVLPNPQEYVELGTKFINGKHVIEVKVEKGKSLYYIKKFGRSANGCYIRMGTSNRSMTEEQIEKAYIATLNIPEKSMKTTESNRQDLTFKQFKTMLMFKDIHYGDETFDLNFNLKTNEGKYNLIAFLLSDQNDTSIKVVRFNGTTKSDFISRKEFEAGCIFKQMEDALEYAQNVLNIVQTKITNSLRVDTPYFDNVAFREAWYNAVCHNLWVEKIPPAIYGFDDRIEIISHGILKKGMTQEDFFSGVSRPVNEEFAKIFMQMQYMEQSGRGVPTVVKKYGKGVYKFGTSFIQCIIPYDIVNENKKGDKKTINDGINDGINGDVKLNEIHKVILDLISLDCKTTVKQVTEQFSKKTRTVERAFKYLKDNGFIKRIGSNKNGYWAILKKQ